MTVNACAGMGRDGQPTQGGYFTHIVVTQDFVLHIPDGLTSTWQHRCCRPASPPTRP